MWFVPEHHDRVVAVVEGDLAVGSHAAGFARFDYFDPSTKKSDNEKLGVTIGATITQDWLLLLPELTYRTSAGALGDKVDTAALVHAIVLY